MKTKTLIRAFLFAITVVSAACDKTDDSEFTDSPIIESYLKPGDYLNAKISRQEPFSSNAVLSPDDINNLKVSVTLSDNTIHALLPIGNEEYVDSSIKVNQGDKYSLSFKYNSKNVTAYTYVPLKPTGAAQSVKEISIQKMTSTSFDPTASMPDPVEISWNNPDNSYYLLVVENVETNLDPIRDFGGKTPPSNFFRKQPTNAASQEIRAMEFQYYGTHRIIIYHVLPDYAALYNQSSASSQNLTNPSSSITNGYGIFTGLNSDTLWLKVKQK